MTPAADIRAALEEMRDELEAQRLEVVLVPQRVYTNVCGMVRVAVSKNAHWYRVFCGRFASSRRRKNSAFDTRIKRRNTLCTLAALIAGRRVTSQYAPYFIETARKRVRDAASRPKPRYAAFAAPAFAADCDDNENPF